LKKYFGGKSIARLNTFSFLKIAIYLFFFFFYLSLNSIIPISLDSFNTVGEKTVENSWTFTELMFLEVILLIILIIISQIPIAIIVSFNNQKQSNKLQTLWRIITLCIFILSGFLTPTIDGFTQLNFAFSGFSVYLISVNILTKRLIIKLIGASMFY
jgi:Sec-independent protein secretion pathway component TatC